MQETEGGMSHTSECAALKIRLEILQEAAEDFRRDVFMYTEGGDTLLSYRKLKKLLDKYSESD
jgi:hypothetical protein